MNTQTLIKGTPIGSGISSFGEKILKDTRSYFEYRNDALMIAKNARKELYLLDFYSNDFFKDDSLIKIILEKPRKGCKLFIASYKDNIKSIREPFRKVRENLSLSEKMNMYMSELRRNSRLIRNVNLYTSDIKHEPGFLASEDSILIKGKINEDGTQDISLRSHFYTEPMFGFSNIVELAGGYGKNFSRKYKQYFKNLVADNKLQKINITK